MSRTVLVLRALKLGDLLTGVPALRAVRRAFPDHRLLLAAPSWLAPLCRHAGLADELTEEDERLLPLAVDSPEIAVDLHGRGPESQQVLLATRPGRLIAFCHPAVDGTESFPAWRPSEHEVTRWCRMLAGHGIAADPADLRIEPPVLELPPFVPGCTVIHPGAASAARRWPATRFASVARVLLAAGEEVVITGSAGELDLAVELAARCDLPPDRVLAGTTDVLGLLGVIAASARVLSGDTGPAHAAVALGTPSVTVFGPVPPSEWGPPPGDPRHVALWAGRRGDPHGTVVDPGMLAVSVRQVLEALAALPLARRG